MKGAEGLGKRKVAITVPEDDTDVIRWLAAQDNMSASVRILIKQAVAQMGMRDAFTALDFSGKATLAPEKEVAVVPDEVAEVAEVAAAAEEEEFWEPTLEGVVSQANVPSGADLRSMLDA